MLFPPQGEDQVNIVNAIASIEDNPGEVYRGVSSAEYKNLLKHGSVVSRGAGNTRDIKGSYVSDTIQLAGRFAFNDYKNTGRGFILVIDREGLPDIQPADPGNYFTSSIPLSAVTTVYNLKTLAKG